MAKVRVSLKGCQKIYENALKLGNGEVQQAMEKSVAPLSAVYEVGKYLHAGRQENCAEGPENRKGVPF